MSIYEFVVLGKPAPQGSMKAFMLKGKPRLTCDNKNTVPFRQAVGWEALRQRPTNDLYAPAGVPVAIHIGFFIAKPTSTAKRVTRPCKKPDLDKLCRAVFDALTGVVWHDDSQVVSLHATKHFAQTGCPERTVISIEVL